MSINPNVVRDLLMHNGKLAEARHYNSLLDVLKYAKEIDREFRGQRSAATITIPRELAVHLHEAIVKTKSDSP